MATKAPPPGSTAARILARGIVQGVGFRPFVKRLADEHRLCGRVRNTPSGVEIHVEGAPASIAAFAAGLESRAPRLARVESVERQDVSPEGCRGFSIAGSAAGTGRTLIAPDVATCERCAREIRDPSDRRYRYPFTTCIDCGPRYSIIQALPYDRPRTTMAEFAMCPACREEYEDPSSRRFHSQPNACPECGPRLTLLTPGGETFGQEALVQAAEALAEGEILAVKGLGGYHLACDATDPPALTALRVRKGRDEKPFAVMAPNLEAIRRYCRLSPTEAGLLSSPEAPIVLLERRRDDGRDDLPQEVAPGLDSYGFFLPYTPLHHLLLDLTARPLVMTSGNLSDEPIAYRDEDAGERLSRLVDASLVHDRPIQARVDDSVVRVFRGAVYPLRRGRGFAPRPLPLRGVDRAILAVGGQTKNAFCLADDGRAFVSPHVGDLDDVATLAALQEEITHFTQLLSSTPALIACDLHPDYASTRLAERLAAEQGVPLVRTQHHAAHVASVLADTGALDREVVGVAFDGAGYGEDGTVWGGEFFAGAPGALTRAAHLETSILPGGERAVREPWRMAVSYVMQLRGEDGLESVIRRLPGGSTWDTLPWRQLVPVIRGGVASPRTSSVGRLFDGVAALLGLRHTVAYEGQAAILLETAARRHFARRNLPRPDESPDWWDDDPTATGLRGAPPIGEAVPLPLGPLVNPLLNELPAGEAPDAPAARFHHLLAWWTAKVAAGLAEEHRVDAVTLGGGVYQNLLLLELTASRLEHIGLEVLVHRHVPTNDGGLALGQAALAARAPAYTRS